MTSPKIMQRKVGTDESEEGYLLVEKAWLSKLPAPGTPFHLTVGKSTLKTRIVEAEVSNGRQKVQYRILLPLMNPTEGSTARLRVVRDDKLVLEYE